MKKVEFVRHGQLNSLRIAEAFMCSGYRVWLEKENEVSRTWVCSDGKTDKIFPTKEAAKNAILQHVEKLLEAGAINQYIVY